MTYRADYGPNDELSKGGFKTVDEAWDYVLEHNCKTCKESGEGIDSLCSWEWDVNKE